MRRGREREEEEEEPLEKTGRRDGNGRWLGRGQALGIALRGLGWAGVWVGGLGQMLLFMAPGKGG